MVHKRFLSIAILVNIFFLTLGSTTTENCDLVAAENKSENFYAKPKKKQSKEPRKLKEKIGQELADSMQLLHKKTELELQVCQEIFKQIEGLVNQDKNNKIINANSKQLQDCVDKLEKINLDLQTDIENLENIKKFFKSGCIN